jgi:hypothetical protein
MRSTVFEGDPTMKTQASLIALLLLGGALRAADNPVAAAAASAAAAPAAAAPAAAAQAAPATPTAAPEAWKDNLVSSLNLSQGHYSNWVAGGDDSLVWIANLGGSADLKGDADELDNNLKLAYGQSQIGSEVRKVADVIHADTDYVQKLNGWVNPFAEVTFDTQFYTGYQYPANGTAMAVSKFMDPGYMTESLGAACGAGGWLKLRVGAASLQVYTHDFQRYAEDAEHPQGQPTRVEYGASATADLTLSLGQNLLFTSEAIAFSNLHSASQIQAKWNNDLTAKVNSWMSAHVDADALYDDSQSTAGQFMESLSLAFSYNLI